MRVVLRSSRVAALVPTASLNGVVVSAGFHIALIVAAVVAASFKAPPKPLDIITVAVLVEEPTPGPVGGAAPAPPPRRQPDPVREETPTPEPEPEPVKPKPQPPRKEPEPVPAKPRQERPPTPKEPDPEPSPAAVGEPATSSARWEEPEATQEQAVVPDTASGTTEGGVGMSAGPAAGSGAPSIDSAAFPFLYYRSIVTNRLRGSWNRPIIPGLREPIRVTVHFEITRTGAITEVAHVSASGVAQLDRSALRAVYDVNPLPPLPEEFEGPRLSANYTFELTPER